jgi:6-methylsalicylate decarboxylase
VLDRAICDANLFGAPLNGAILRHMIAKQIPYRYPRIKFIVPHLGGPIPMLMNRLNKQGQGPRGHPNLAEAPSVTARRFYYDTVCCGSKPGVPMRPRSVRRRSHRDRQPLSGIAGLGGLPGDLAYIERLGLPKEVTDKLLHHKAQKLFGFDH